MRGGRGKAIVAVGCAAALAFGLSGCFLWSSFKWSTTKVKPGKSTDAIIGMTPETGDITGSKDYPFIMVGLTSTSNLSLAGITRRTWDVKGKFKGPRPLQTDGGLEAAVLASDNCNVNGIEINQILEVEWTALRPDVQVNDRDRAGVIAQSKIRFKADPGTPPRDEQVYFFSGGWRDESPANGITEPEEVGCSGGTITALSIVD
jgi:hypothetical protein